MRALVRMRLQPESVGQRSPNNMSCATACAREFSRERTCAYVIQPLRHYGVASSPKKMQNITGQNTTPYNRRVFEHNTITEIDVNLLLMYNTLAVAVAVAVALAAAAAVAAAGSGIG